MKGGSLNISGTHTILNDDMDCDGMPDAWEISTFGNLSTADESTDFDGDGLPDVIEYAHNTSPKASDTDNDGISDKWEVDHHLNPISKDSFGDLDGDGFSNFREYLSGSDPEKAGEIPLIFYDFDEDEDSDGYDLSAVIQELGRQDCSPALPCRCDLNADGRVDLIDLRCFSEDFARISEEGQ